MSAEELLKAAAESLAAEPAFRAELNARDLRRVDLYARDVEEAGSHRAKVEALLERIAVALEQVAQSQYSSAQVAKASLTGTEKESGRQKPCGECGNAGFGHYVACSRA